MIENFELNSFLYSLLNITGIGSRRIINLIEAFRSEPKLISASNNSISIIPGLSKDLAARIKHSLENSSEIKQRFNVLCKQYEEPNYAIINYWDNDYPIRLKNIYNPPILLYTKGDISVFSKNPIAIVGTRKASNYGKVMAEKFSSDLTESGLTIVSGMARGIDSIAHRACLKTGGKTIAVVGAGLDVIYPAENKKLFEEIALNGCVVSEFEPGTKPDAQNFPRRNRIISGLAAGVLVIESTIKGGALQTANYAFDQNREVFCIPGNLDKSTSEGTNYLIKCNKAKLVTNAEDILFELGFKKDNRMKQRINIELNVFEKAILDAIGNDEVHIDKIADLSGLSGVDCSVNLLTLEMNGFVKQLPGKNFIKL